MSYFWPEGYQIAVQTEQDGSPKSISWDWYSGIHEIGMILDCWSVDDTWWIERKYRTYYFVVTDDGQALVIFRNELKKDWYIQWLYD
jgi:hypothetical protein